MAEAKGAAAKAAVETRTNVGARLTYEDMREWIREAEKLGEVKVVNGASWQKDIGMSAEVVLHSEKAPDGNLWGWLLPQESKR